MPNNNCQSKHSLLFFSDLDHLFLQDSSLLSLPFLASELYRNVTRRSTSSILKRRSKPFVRNFQKKSIRQPLECSGYQKVFTNQQLNYFIFIKKQFYRDLLENMLRQQNQHAMKVRILRERKDTVVTERYNCGQGIEIFIELMSF